MSELVQSESVPDKKVRRSESFFSAIILTLGLAAWQSGDYRTNLSLLLFALLPLITSFWVIQLSLRPKPERFEVYATVILPVLLYLSLLFFLNQVENGAVIGTTIALSLPVYYVTFLSLSAIERYYQIPSHVGRVIISVLALFTAYVSYGYVFQAQVPIWQGVLQVFVIAWLLLAQGILYWSGGSIPYTVFYSTFCAFLMTLFYCGIYLWPMGYLVTGLMMMSGHYALTGVLRTYFRKKLTTSIVVEHLTVSFAVLVLILLNVDWGFVL